MKGYTVDGDARRNGYRDIKIDMGDYIQTSSGQRKPNSKNKFVQ
jgi:hypothetical protein